MNGSWRIPFFGIQRQYQTLKEEILHYTDKVYTSGQVLDGDFTKAFESLMAKRCNRKYAVAVNSGTQALIFALRTHLGVDNSNGKVIVPAISYIATLNAIHEAGLSPVFCDVDPLTGLIDIKDISVHSNDITAILYVNLFGNCADFDRFISYEKMFSNHKITLIEDAAQSFGASWGDKPSGSLGELSCLSFDPTKNLNNYGSGGMVLTDNHDQYLLLQSLRDNGKRSDHVITGTNSKMSEVDCAHMLVKMKYFDEWQKRRQEIANYYTEELQDYVLTPDHHEMVTHAWSKYVCHHNERTMIISMLAAEGIESKIHYPKPMHLEGVGIMSSIQHDGLILEGAEEFCKTTFSLPMYPELTDEEVESVVTTVKYCTAY